MLTAIQRVLDDGEGIVGRAWCWGVTRRRHRPLLLARRRRYDAVVTDRRLVLVTRRRRALTPSDVVLVKRFEAIVLLEEHWRPTLLQQELRVDTDTTLVLEWPMKSRALGRTLSEALHVPVHQQVR